MFPIICSIFSLTFFPLTITTSSTSFNCLMLSLTYCCIFFFALLIVFSVIVFFLVKIEIIFPGHTTISTIHLAYSFSHYLYVRNQILPNIIYKIRPTSSGYLISSGNAVASKSIPFTLIILWSIRTD